MPNPPETLSTREAAARLGVHPNTILNWYKSGILRGYKLGPGKTSDLRIEVASIKALEAQRKRGSQA